MRHKAWAMLAFVLAACLLCCGALADEAVIDGKTADRVHLRAGRSEQSKSMGLYFTGTLVQCEPDPVGDWVAVNIGSEMGYIKADYLIDVTMGSNVSACQTGMVSNPNDSWVNFRQSPSKNAPVLARINDGTALTVLGETASGWYYVQLDNQKGYIMSSLISLQKIDKMGGFPFQKKTSWVFSSGVGAWSTLLHVNADGTFSGYHEDWDMGDTGKSYPNGTHYECSFSGSFGQVKQVSDWEYQMTVTQLISNGTQDEEKIVDGVRVITSISYGLSEGDLFSIYLSGTAQSVIPEEYFTWVQDNCKGGRLINAALYNQTEGFGFQLE